MAPISDLNRLLLCPGEQEMKWCGGGEEIIVVVDS
jgi:hypothetical protein